MYSISCLTVEAFVHTSLDHYAFIAVTASSSTLYDLIKMVKDDNSRRQMMMDKTGHNSYRELNVSPFHQCLSILPH